jgi:hypothetical protein
MTAPSDALLAGSRVQPDPFPAMPICWPALSPEEEAEAFDALEDWVAWLIDRYGLDHRTIPPCWAEHGALLEELSALRTGWLAAYSLTSTGDRPLDWHADFATARHRLTEWAARTGCRAGQHRSDLGTRSPGTQLSRRMDWQTQT